MYALTINMNGSSRNSEHETLCDARAALIRYQSRDGLLCSPSMVGARALE